MNNIERAAEVIATATVTLPMTDGREAIIGGTPTQIAQALADAGLLVTDAERAVLDAAEALVQADQYGAVGEYAAANMVLTRAVNARKAAQR